MLNTLIKRSGKIQEFTPEKTNHWLIWGAKDIADRLDWSSIVMSARSAAPEKMTTQEWQMFLITALKTRGSMDDGWPYMLMAGRLYTVYLMKLLHGDKYPTLKEHLDLVYASGASRNLGYLDEEIDYIDKFILDHEANLTMAYPQVEQYYRKYSLRDRVTDQVYETPQFTMIRMAMTVCEGDQPITRLKRVKETYDSLLKDTINPPTPNYSALGTRHYGMASCCLIASDDDARSILVAGVVGYMMTLASGGLGIQGAFRAPGDPVDGGRVEHAGRLNYDRFFIGATTANKQGMRGGALNLYDTVFSPEYEQNAMLQNPRTPVEVRERRVNVTYQTNAFFVKKAIKGEQYFTFTKFSAPDLYEAFFKADQTEFEQLYAKYEADPKFKKDYHSARRTLNLFLAQELEVSTVFWNDPSEMNRHTSFKDTIRQSNLCVAPETEILTNQGYVNIKERVGLKTNVWNGEEFSEVDVVKTSDNSKLLTVTTSFGFNGRFTEMHKWYIDVDGQEVEIRTKDLKPGMKLVKWEKPKILEAAFNPDAEYDTKKEAVEQARLLQAAGCNVRIESCLGTPNGRFYVLEEVGDEFEEIYSVVDNNEFSETYCFTEHKKHRGVFNGMYTGQCLEVMVPTNPWYDLQDLYGDGDPSKGEVGICNIGSIAIHNLPFDPRNPKLGFNVYKRAVRSMMEIIDYAIDNSEYHFPAVKTQAISRRNCSVGMSGVATLMAKLNLKFNSPEGRKVWHMLNERHMYACIEVALELGKERGNAPWMHRTKWPDGWTPVDTYKKNIDKYVDNTLYFDWEDISARVVENKGIRFSSLVAHMPGEQATRKGNGSNSIYPLLGLSVDKSDGSSATNWTALDNDIIGHQYQYAYDMTDEDTYIHYGICQKWTDQGISADDYMNRVVNTEVSEELLLNRAAMRMRVGMKGKYYGRSLTDQGGKQLDIEVKPEAQMEDDGFQAGASCTLDGVCGA